MNSSDFSWGPSVSLFEKKKQLKKMIAEKYQGTDKDNPGDVLRMILAVSYFGYVKAAVQLWLCGAIPMALVSAFCGVIGAFFPCLYFNAIFAPTFALTGLSLAQMMIFSVVGCLIMGAVLLTGITAVRLFQYWSLKNRFAGLLKAQANDVCQASDAEVAICSLVDAVKLERKLITRTGEHENKTLSASTACKGVGGFAACVAVLSPLSGFVGALALGAPLIGAGFIAAPFFMSVCIGEVAIILSLVALNYLGPLFEAAPTPSQEENFLNNEKSHCQLTMN